MGTTTTNLALYKPTAGESGWASLVNANFDTLDRVPWADIRAYGATSGGAAATNTTAIQAAIDAMDALGGGTVYVPPGGYTINQITLKSKVQLLGSGWGSSLTCNNNVATAMITMAANTTNYTRIRHLFLNGNKAGQTSTTPDAVLYQSGGAGGNYHHVIEDCFIYQFKQHGINCAMQHARFERNYIYGCDGCGVYVNTPDVSIEGNKIASSGLECIFMDTGSSNGHMAHNQVWAAGQIDAARGDGVRIASSNVQAVNTESADNMRHGWNLESCYYAQIWAHVENNNASGTGGAAYRISGGGSHYIRGWISGGSRSVQSSLIQWDTDGSYPHYCNIDIDYSTATIGANPEFVGTIASDNVIRVGKRINSAGLVIDSTNTATAITLSGTFSSYGIDMNAGTFTSGAIRLKNSSPVYGRNNAASADVALFRINTLDEMQIDAAARFANGFTVSDTKNMSFSTTTGTKIGTGTTQKIGFWNKAPVVQPSAYTQTYATADKTLGAYTSDPESSAYTGAADSEAKLADLNALRVAYENLRVFTEDLAAFTNSIVDDLQATGLVA